MSSKNHPNDNIYSILGKLKALEPAPAEVIKDRAQQIRESVESQGSILAGLREVSDVEQRLMEKWGTEMHTAEKDKGMFKDKSKQELKKQKANLMKKDKRDAAEQKKVKQINFALRAKNKFGKATESIEKPEDLGAVVEINQLIAKGMHETEAIHAVAKKYGDNPSELTSFYYQNNRMSETIHYGTYGTKYNPGDPSDPSKGEVEVKREPRKGEAGARSKAERQAAGDAAPDLDTSHLGSNPFSQKVVKQPEVWKGPVTKISGARSDDTTNADDTGDTPEQRAKKLKAKFKKTGKIGETNLSLSESVNFKHMAETHKKSMEECMNELNRHFTNYQMTGECSDLLHGILQQHHHHKMQESSGKLTPDNYELPPSMRHDKFGKQLPNTATHDAGRSMHPPKLNTPNPASVRDELDEIARMAGLHVDEETRGEYIKDKEAEARAHGKHTAHAFGQDFEVDESSLDEAQCNECGMYESQCSCQEGNLFTKHLKDTPKGGDFEIDGKHYTDTSNLDETAELNELAKLAGLQLKEMNKESDDCCCDDKGEDKCPVHGDKHELDEADAPVVKPKSPPVNSGNKNTYRLMDQSTMTSGADGANDNGTKKPHAPAGMGDNAVQEPQYRVKESLEAQLAAEYESIKRSS